MGIPNISYERMIDYGNYGPSCEECGKPHRGPICRECKEKQRGDN